jgi:hypothetical protein
MAVVSIKGVFMGANVREREYEGNKRTEILIDVYQQDSPDADKVVQIKTDDIQLLNQLNSEYAMGSIFECTATVNAYKNKAYYKLLKVVG